MKAGGKRIRFHKFVYLYLLTYRSGSTEDHDRQVNEARRGDIDLARQMLAFESKRAVAVKAKEMIESLT